MILSFPFRQFSRELGQGALCVAHFTFALLMIWTGGFAVREPDWALLRVLQSAYRDGPIPISPFEFRCLLLALLVLGIAWTVSGVLRLHGWLRPKLSR